jgi:signal transduction histidine kinase
MSQGGLLKIITRRSEDTIFIEFSDTGEGIAAENLPRLFEPFFTTRQNGTGLGLFLSQIIMDIHRGTIEILNRPGKGTTVIVKLPFSPTNQGVTHHVLSQ